jgi:hypothetical protein
LIQSSLSQLVKITLSLLMGRQKPCPPLMALTATGAEVVPVVDDALVGTLRAQDVSTRGHAITGSVQDAQGVAAVRHATVLGLHTEGRHERDHRWWPPRYLQFVADLPSGLEGSCIGLELQGEAVLGAQGVVVAAARGQGEGYPCLHCRNR